jgi:hypothetical protein
MTTLPLLRLVGKGLRSARGPHDQGKEVVTGRTRLGEYDTKTSSWVKTPADIRKLGGALFCDYRYGQVFVYHNGAESYYGARAFRGSLRV